MVHLTGKLTVQPGSMAALCEAGCATLSFYDTAGARLSKTTGGDGSRKRPEVWRTSVHNRVSLRAQDGVPLGSVSPYVQYRLPEKAIMARGWLTRPIFPQGDLQVCSLDGVVCALSVLQSRAARGFVDKSWQAEATNEKGSGTRHARMRRRANCTDAGHSRLTRLVTERGHQLRWTAAPAI